MALETASVSDLIQIDKDFFSRLALRKQILSTSLQSALRASPAAHPAIAELYTFLVTTYLPTRFPSIFRLVPPSLKNLVSNETYPLQCPDHPLQALQTLGTLVDEDFMFLLPAPDGDGYTLQAYTVCYASGFAMERLFAAKLRDIHAEVPGYKDRLQTSMDRWFARLEAGRFVRRTNTAALTEREQWTITMSGQLRNAHGENQIYSDSGASSAEAPAADIDISNAHLRTERQHVFRLPRTGAIVFAFKTYLYPLADVKVEGNGEALAAAVEGLKTGNVPEMARYKGANRWGEKVVQFLRAGSGEGDA
ncbi:hypothetical protein MMC30_007678 [Trapelia coarctata]|nr:hypothetical protein [Trapelia coarctata]